MKKLIFWAPSVIGIANLILANGNLWMVITGLLLIGMQIWDVYESL